MTQPSDPQPERPDLGLYERAFLVRCAQKIALSSSGCWEWTGALDRYGYGQIGFRGAVVGAHRSLYQVINGSIGSLHIDHLCRNRKCVNPAHMEAVSKRINDLRGQSFAAKNARKSHCPLGHPYKGENLGFVEAGRSRPKRYCKICNRMNAKKYAR